MCCVCTYAELSILFHLGIIRLVNEGMCSGDNLTFSCQGPGVLVWTLTDLPGVSGVMNDFGRDLNMERNAERITSTDTQLGSSPSTITIVNATVADNGARVQCRILNGESGVVTLSIRELTNIVASYCVTMLSDELKNPPQTTVHSQGLPLRAS